MVKALALMSGGLDSLLAARLIQDMGIEVLCLCFESAFFNADKAKEMSAKAGLTLRAVDFTAEHLEMVKNPQHGYGKNMNPCIDCHAMMLNYAGKMLEEEKADFIITGEVLDQRPMSQNVKSLEIVKKTSGYEDKILRPLSALRLAQTQMEIDGLVDREKLLGFNGKTRKPQIELAKQMGITDYPSPAGGCLLTESQFSNKLRDLLEHNKNANAADANLLKIGRHFRINDDLKVVCNRTQDEYEALMKAIKPTDIVMNTSEYTGSTIIGILNEGYEITEDDLKLLGGITGRYSKGREKDKVLVKYKTGIDGEYKEIEAKPHTDEELAKYLVC